jgi:hypothetical protein
MCCYLSIFFGRNGKKPGGLLRRVSLAKVRVDKLNPQGLRPWLDPPPGLVLVWVPAL